MLGILLICLPAWGQDLRAWQGMHDGMLIELIDGDIDQAVDWYEGLITALPESDPSRPQLEYWQARALYARGDVEDASEALRNVLKLSPQARSAAIFLARLQATERRIKKIPIHHSFRTSTENWVHGWRNPGKGSLSLGQPDGGGDRTLAWTTRVQEGEDDAIGIFFDQGVATPRMIRLSIRSDELSAMVLPTIVDRQGNRYTLSSPISLHRKDWVAMDLRLNDFRPVEQGSSSMRPNSVQSFQIRDVTAFFSSDRGSNTLFLGDVVIE